MTLYSLVLFALVTAVLGLCCALSFEVLSLFHLRRASSLTDPSRWIEPVPRLPFLAGGSSLVIFFSGSIWRSECQRLKRPGQEVAVGALLISAPLGTLTGRRLGAIRRACADANAINSEFLSRLQDPFLKISLGIRIGIFLGIVLLIAAKPGWWESIGIVGTSVAEALGTRGTTPGVDNIR
jgi:hypothetical protein